MTSILSSQKLKKITIQGDDDFYHWFLFDVGVGWSDVLEGGVSTRGLIPGPNPSSDPHHPRVPHLAHVERPRPKSYRGPSTIKVNIGLPRL